MFTDRGGEGMAILAPLDPLLWCINHRLYFSEQDMASATNLMYIEEFISLSARSERVKSQEIQDEKANCASMTTEQWQQFLISV